MLTIKGFTSNAFGFVDYFKVKGLQETEDEIILSGINANNLSEDVTKNWSSSKISSNMFLSLRGKTIRFQKFYAVEVLFILNELLNAKYTRSSKRDIRACIDLLLEKSWLSSTLRETRDIVDLSLLNQLTWSILPTQLDFLKHYNSVVPKYNLRGYMLGAKPGTGKAQPLYSKIKVPGGWLTMGDMKLGTRVIASDGSISKVTGVYPQGKKEVFELEFEDGRKTRCSEDHLWSVFVGQDPIEQVVDLKYIVRLINLGYNVSIPTIKPEVRGIDLDDEIVLSRVENLLYDSFFNDSSLEPDYLHMSIRSREVFIEKLFFSITNAVYVRSNILANQIRDILWSTGYVCFKRKEINGGFTLSTRRKPSSFRKSYIPEKLKLSRITKLGEEEVQCISINHPKHLYVTDDYIVTHNTFNSLALMHCLGMDTVLVVSPKNAITEVWEKTILSIHKTPKTVWTSQKGGELPDKKNYYVVHYEHLSYLMEFMKKHEYELGRIGLILDESHNLNLANKQSIRTEIFVKIAKLPSIKHVLWQSGTPLKAIGKEAIPFLETIDRYFTSDVKESFAKIFGKDAKRGIDILANRIGLTTFVVDKLTKNELVIEELKIKIPDGKDYTLEVIGKKMRDFIVDQINYYEKNMDSFVNIYFKLIEKAKKRSTANEKQWMDYLALTKFIRESYDPNIHKTEPTIALEFENKYIIPFLDGKDKADFKDCRSVYKYYWMKVQGEALGRVLGRARTECAVKMALNMKEMINSKGEKVSDIDLIKSSESKTVVFTSYVQVVDQYASYLKSQGFDPRSVHGGTNKDLNTYLKEFKTKYEVNPIVATYLSLSTAVPLIEASTMLMLNQPFRDNERVQAIARCDRLGQNFTVRVFDTFLDTGNEPNISTRSKDILEWSRDQVEKIMKRTTSVVALESSYDVKELADRTDEDLEIFMDIPIDKDINEESLETNQEYQIKFNPSIYYNSF